MYYFALFTTILSLIILLYTVVKVPSINYFIIIVIIYGFIIRPYAVKKNGGTLITENYFNMGDYEFGYFVASIYLLLYSIGLKIGSTELNILKKTKLKYQIYNDKKLINFFFSLTIILCLILLYIGGAEILFMNRETTMSIQSPLIRYLYPFITVLLCASTIHAILDIFYRNIFIGIMKIIVLFIVTSIIAQRGFFIIFIIIGLSLVVFYNKKQMYNFKMLILMIFILLTLFLKDLIVSIYGNEISLLKSSNIIERVLLRPDGDVTEVWMLTVQYLSNQDYLYGVSIFNNIFNLIPHNVRHSIGLDNGQDILNGFFSDSRYWDYGFGFNVTLPIEAYLNFGFYGIIIVFFAGYIMGRAITHNYKSILVYGQDPALCSLRLYAIWTITTSFAGLQWAVLFYFIYKIIKWVGYGQHKKL